MWKEKTLSAKGRLPEDFGRAVQRHCDFGNAQEHVTRDDYEWRAGTRVKELSPQSEWAITMWASEKIARPFYAMLTGKSDEHVKEYVVVVTAYRLVDDTIKLVVTRGTEEDWSKLEGLWNKVWEVLQDQGYKEAPSPGVSAPAARQKLAERDADDTDIQERKELLRGYLERVLIKAQSQRLAAELAGGNRSSLERWRKEFPEVEEEVRAAIKKRK